MAARATQRNSVSKNKNKTKQKLTLFTGKTSHLPVPVSYTFTISTVTLPGGPQETGFCETTLTRTLKSCMTVVKVMMKLFLREVIFMFLMFHTFSSELLKLLLNISLKFKEFKFSFKFI